MPHHPSEEQAPENLTDKVAAQSKDSTASDHPLHDENKGPTEQVKKSDVQALSSNPGTQQLDANAVPEKRSNAELDEEAKKLNS